MSVKQMHQRGIMGKRNILVPEKPKFKFKFGHLLVE